MTKPTKTIKDIWKKRQKWMKNKTWRGDDPKAGFDFSDGIKPYLRYTKDNWNDLMIRDLRELLNDIVFDFEYTEDPWINTKYEDRGQVAITADVVNDQAYMVIKLSGYGMYAISWYKRRGRIDAIIELDYGDGITVTDMTELLYRLGLEDAYAEDGQ